MRLKSGQWVVVADGAKGLVLMNEGTAAEPQLRVVRNYHQDDTKTSDLGRDRPGRTYESASPRRSATEAPDLHQRAEDVFVTDILSALAQDAAAGAFKELVVVAPPKALAVMRKSVSKSLKPHIIAWIDKDLTKEPLPQITAAVVKALDKTG